MARRVEMNELDDERAKGRLVVAGDVTRKAGMRSDVERLGQNVGNVVVRVDIVDGIFLIPGDLTLGFAHFNP